MSKAFPGDATATDLFVMLRRGLLGAGESTGVGVLAIFLIVAASLGVEGSSSIDSSLDFCRL